MSDFSPDGEHREYPHLTVNETQTGEFTQWPQKSLEELNDQYQTFIADPNSFPPHVERAKQIYRHIAYELGCRVMDRMKEISGGK
jgi:hypothetical protein